MRFAILICYLLIRTGDSFSQTDHLSEIKNIIEAKYAFDINLDSILTPLLEQKLEDTAIIRELVSHLDPHSQYLDEPSYNQFKSDMSGKFYGTGITIMIRNDTVIVSRVFEGGPAFKAGLMAGDKFIQINGKDFTGRTIVYDEVISNLKGEKDTEVEVIIQRNNRKPFLHFKIIRDEIALSSVNSFYMLSHETGYIKFSAFTASTAEDFHNALLQLKKKGMKKLILDLRDNTGGYMKAARAVADEFLKSNKLIVYTEGKAGSKEEYFTDAKGLFEKGEMILLISEATASSAEILAGALQDNYRAKVIGNRSYGKGLIQQIFPIGDSATALILTTSRYFTPSGRCIQRSYEYGIDAYYREYRAIINNHGVLPDSIASKREISWGIIPDRFVIDTNAANQFFKELFYRNYLSEFSVAYYADHTTGFQEFNTADELADHFTVNDSMFALIVHFIEIKQLTPDEYYGKLIYTDGELVEARPQIENAVKAYLAQIKWGDNEFYRLLNRTDNEINLSMELLNEK